VTTAISWDASSFDASCASRLRPFPLPKGFITPLFRHRVARLCLLHGTLTGKNISIPILSPLWSWSCSSILSPRRHSPPKINSDSSRWIMEQHQGKQLIGAMFWFSFWMQSGSRNVNAHSDVA
jgi:hypothetical protein